MLVCAAALPVALADSFAATSPLSLIVCTGLMQVTIELVGDEGVRGKWREVEGGGGGGENGGKGGREVGREGRGGGEGSRAKLTERDSQTSLGNIRHHYSKRNQDITTANQYKTSLLPPHTAHRYSCYSLQTTLRLRPPDAATLSAAAACEERSPATCSTDIEALGAVGVDLGGQALARGVLVTDNPRRS